MLENLQQSLVSLATFGMSVEIFRRVQVILCWGVQNVCVILVVLLKGSVSPWRILEVVQYLVIIILK